MNNKLIVSLFIFCLCFVGPQDIALMNLSEEEAAALEAQAAAHHDHEQETIDSDDEDDVCCSCFCSGLTQFNISSVL